jgi:hypothetical protein
MTRFTLGLRAFVMAMALAALTATSAVAEDPAAFYRGHTV